MKKLDSIYSILIGILMLVFWIVLLISDNIPELNTTPNKIIAHIIAESLTAILLIAAGILKILKFQKANYYYLLAMGMLVYTLIASIGYYAESGDIMMISMFVFLLITSIVFIFNKIVSKS